MAASHGFCFCGRNLAGNERRETRVETVMRPHVEAFTNVNEQVFTSHIAGAVRPRWSRPVRARSSDATFPQKAPGERSSTSQTRPRCR